MFHFGLPMNSGIGMPVMFGSSGMTTCSQNAIVKFDTDFPDMQNKLKFIASIPYLSPQHQEEYSSLTIQFRAFERADNTTDVNLANCIKIGLSGRIIGIKSRVDNLYNQLSAMVMPTPIQVTTTTTPVPSQGSGSMPTEIAAALRKLRNNRMS